MKYLSTYLIILIFIFSSACSQDKSIAQEKFIGYDVFKLGMSSDEVARLAYDNYSTWKIYYLEIFKQGYTESVRLGYDLNLYKDFSNSPWKNICLYLTDGMEGQLAKIFYSQRYHSRASLLNDFEKYLEALNLKYGVGKKVGGMTKWDIDDDQKISLSYQADIDGKINILYVNYVHKSLEQECENYSRSILRKETDKL